MTSIGRTLLLDRIASTAQFTALCIFTHLVNGSRLLSFLKCSIYCSMRTYRGANYRVYIVNIQYTGIVISIR